MLMPLPSACTSGNWLTASRGAAAEAVGVWISGIAGTSQLVRQILRLYALGWSKTLTRLTSILANFSGIRFTHLPILPRGPLFDQWAQQPKSMKLWATYNLLRHPYISSRKLWSASALNPHCFC